MLGCGVAELLPEPETVPQPGRADDDRPAVVAEARPATPRPCSGRSLALRWNCALRHADPLAPTPPPRDPEAKGLVERFHDYLERSWLPGREFASPADFNAQLGVFLARANTRPAAGLLVQIRCLADYDAALGVDGGAA